MASEYWQINEDGYYPYCPICLEEPPRANKLPKECPNCGTKLKNPTYKHKSKRGVDER